MKKWLVALIALSFTFSAYGNSHDVGTFKKLPKTWKEIIESPDLVKSPTKDELMRQAIPATGSFEIHMVSDRFAFLFNPEGFPMVAFDLTMENIGWGDAILGAVGLGRFSLYNIFKKYSPKKEKEYLEAADAINPEKEDFEDEMLPPATAKDIKKAKKAFKKFKFKETWIESQGHFQALKEGRNDGFEPASFRFSDLLLKLEQREKFIPALNAFSTLLFQEEVTEKNFDEFVSQFKFEWDEKRADLILKWEPKQVSFLKEKQPVLPMWVLNFTNPTDILAYKYYLRNIERMTTTAEIILDVYGRLLGHFVTRVINNLHNRMENHENQLAVLMEGAMRDEYKIKIPLLERKDFLNQSINLLYTNKMVETEDITDGAQKRQKMLEEEAQFRKQHLAWFEKKGFDLMTWADGRTVTTFKQDKRKGVMSLAMKPMWITKRPSSHYFDSAPWYKELHRFGMEVLVGALRFYLPTAINFSRLIGNMPINFSIFIPGGIWDMLFRARGYAETGYEGYILGQVNETLAGRWNPGVPGYEVEELVKMKKVLSNQRANPFEVPHRKEKDAIKKNYDQIMRVLSGGVVDLENLKMVTKAPKGL